MNSVKQRDNERLVARLQGALEAVGDGKMIIITDSPQRENEGDFFIAAQYSSPQLINRMIRYGRGMVCCPVSHRVARRLHLYPQSRHNRALHGTRFTVSVDARSCRGSGISTADRSESIRVLSDPVSVPRNLVRPGHISPIVGHRRGLLARPGHTEAALALLALAGLHPVGVICEIIADDGTMAQGEQLQKLARRWNMPVISVEEIIDYLSLSGDTS